MRLFGQVDPLNPERSETHFMRIFDHVDPLNLERSETHLWSLSLVTIFAFAVAIAVLMYPTVFLQPVTFSGGAVRNMFVGFCVLAGLHFGYLLDRHVVVARLRRQLEEERKKVARVRHQASDSLLDSLPGFAQFQDHLAMEYRRDSSASQYLSLLVLALKEGREVAGTPEGKIAIGDAAQALIRKLRGEDSVYLIGANNFCIVLPGVNHETASVVSRRLSEGLLDASGTSKRFTFEILALNYPADVQSAREIEAAVRPFVDKPGQKSTDKEAYSRQSTVNS